MMGKIKLNLVSGAVVEKPLINAFKASNNTYIVLDNEMNGSMGLPIILVCKLENNRVTKIIDQGEWQVVKEYLKNIIAGNQIEFVKVESELAADDIYYTQLTLPVPSFDALKNAYKVEESSTSETSILDFNPEPVPRVAAQDFVSPVAPVTPSEPVIPEVQIPAMENPVTENVVPNIGEAPVVDINIPKPTEISSPEINVSSPVIDFNTPMPTFGGNVNNVQSEVVTPVTTVMPEPEITPTPVINTEVSNISNNVDIFKEQKEAFMQACENMFDALVQKFEKELENRK